VKLRCLPICRQRCRRVGALSFSHVRILALFQVLTAGAIWKERCTVVSVWRNKRVSPRLTITMPGLFFVREGRNWLLCVSETLGRTQVQASTVAASVHLRGRSLSLSDCYRTILGRERQRTQCETSRNTILQYACKSSRSRKLASGLRLDRLGRRERERLGTIFPLGEHLKYAPEVFGGKMRKFAECSGMR
jgi:hypothetical protein